METITAPELASRLGAGAVALVDVREVHEYAAGHVPQAVSIPMSVLPVRLTEIPRDVPVHLICASGARSAQVGLWLDQQGYTTVNVAGGTGAWVVNGGPLASGMGR